MIRFTHHAGLPTHPTSHALRCQVLCEHERDGLHSFLKKQKRKKENKVYAAQIGEMTNSSPRENTVGEKPFNWVPVSLC